MTGLRKTGQVQNVTRIGHKGKKSKLKSQGKLKKKITIRKTNAMTSVWAVYHRRHWGNIQVIHKTLETKKQKKKLKMWA